MPFKVPSPEGSSVSQPLGEWRQSRRRWRSLPGCCQRKRDTSCLRRPLHDLRTARRHQHRVRAHVRTAKWVPMRMRASLGEHGVTNVSRAKASARGDIVYAELMRMDRIIVGVLPWPYGNPSRQGSVFQQHSRWVL